MILISIVSEGDDYFSTNIYADAWKNASTEDKTNTLTMATRAMLLLNYNNLDLTTDTVPQQLKDACCDEALELLTGANPAMELATIGQGSQGFSSVRSTYDSQIAQYHIRAGFVSALAWNKILPYLHEGKTFKLSRVS